MLFTRAPSLDRAPPHNPFINAAGGLIGPALALRVRDFIDNNARLSLKEPGDDLAGEAGQLGRLSATV